MAAAKLSRTILELAFDFAFPDGALAGAAVDLFSPHAHNAHYLPDYLLCHARRPGQFMAAAAITPRIRLMAICDGVRESRTEAGVFHLRGVRQEIVANRIPFDPSRLWLFLLLSSPRPGKFPGYVRVVNDRTDKAIFYGKMTPAPTFGREEKLQAKFMPIRCLFPEEGSYTVQLWFFQEQGSDVLKGEMPFCVIWAGA
jgi:hypothetical protein